MQTIRLWRWDDSGTALICPTANKRHCEDVHLEQLLPFVHFLWVLELNLGFYCLFLKALNGWAPAYRCDILSPYESDCCLRSFSRALFKVSTYLLVSEGNRVFAVSAPQLWNLLPGDLRLANWVSSFKSPLKAHFNHMAFSSFFVCFLLFFIVVLYHGMCAINQIVVVAE